MRSFRTRQFAVAVQQRFVTSRGQYNPIHRFQLLSRQGKNAKDYVAHQLPDFMEMITNPGPLRVAYSKDYVDWYFRAYRQKVKRLEAKAKAESKLSGHLTIENAFGVPKGMFLRPATSSQRMRGEAMRQEALETIDAASVEHGMSDLFERQPQFAAIHIDRCSNFHIREILQEHFISHTTSATELWEKALMYRALLQMKAASYPDSFGYIQQAVEDVVFAPRSEDPQRPGSFVETDTDKYPSLSADAYFKYLVHKYHVENALDIHVVLQCHRQSDAAKLLFSHPPPRELAKGESTPEIPARFPPLSALIEDGNMPLAKCLVFGEFNTMVSYDPFVKYPGARAFVTKPLNELSNALKGAGGSGAAQAISQRRGKMFPSFTQMETDAYDGRGRDVMRMQKQRAASDGLFNRELARLADESPELYQGDLNFFNPRTTRAEIRDQVSRRLLKALHKYDTAKGLIYRMDLFDADIHRRRRAGLKEVQPPFYPTIPHFLRLLLSDPHVSFVVSLLPAEEGNEVRSAAAGVARQMLKLALDYHDKAIRAINHKKMQVAAALLDSLVQSGIRKLRTNPDLTTILDDLGEATPWATRPLGENGFPTPARFDDYQRWISTSKPLL